jgi:hypothetical protein
VLIDNHFPAVLESLGLGWPALRERNPRLIYTSITPYGRTGARANHKGTDMTGYHAGGLGTLMPPRSSDVSRAPTKAGGYPTGYHAGLTAGLATAAAIFGQRDGEGCLSTSPSRRPTLHCPRLPRADGLPARDVESRADRPPASDGWSARTATSCRTSSKTTTGAGWWS